MQRTNKVLVSLSVKMSKTAKKSHSKVLKCIVTCLESKRFPHVLKWINREEREFEIVFVHKCNPQWNPCYLDLFKELDKISPKKFQTYLNKPSYELDCKVRCKSNLTKLCKDGVLSRSNRGKYYKSKSNFSMCYRINDTLGIYLPRLDKPKMDKKQNAYEMAVLSGGMSIQADVDNTGNLIDSCVPQEGTISHESTEGFEPANVLTNQNSMENVMFGIDTIPLECFEVLGSTNMLTNQRSIKQEFDVGNVGVCTISEESTEGFDSANMLTNQKSMENGINMDSATFGIDTTLHESIGGFTYANMLTNQKSMETKFEMRNEIYFDTIPLECFEVLGSTNMLTNRKSIKQEFDVGNVGVFGPGVTCDYGEFSEDSLYQTAQRNLNLVTNKVNITRVKDENAVSPDRLETNEVSFNFNNYIEQGTPPSNFQTKEFYVTAQEDFIQKNCLDPLDVVLGMFEDPSIVVNMDSAAPRKA